MSFIPKDNDLLLKEKPVLCYYNRLSLPIITSYFQICLVAASQASWAEKLYAKIFSTAISNKLLKQILQGLGFFFLKVIIGKTNPKLEILPLERLSTGALRLGLEF